MVKCPRCGEEVEYFTRKKKSYFARCPKCRKSFKVKDYPELEQYVRVVESEVGETRVENSKQPPKLFDEPKPVEEILYEVLSDWGCDETFINTVVRYVERKGYLDPSWLMNLLLHGRTGRKFTDQEAYMVVDEIVSIIESEKRKAEALNRPYIGTVVWGALPRPPVVLPPQPITQYPQQPYYIPQQPQTYVQPPPQYQQPQYIPQYVQQPQQQITLETIQEMINKAMDEYKRKSEFDEVRKSVSDVEKKLIESRSEVEKLIGKTYEEILKAVKEILASIPTQQVPQPSIDRKDIELIKTDLEKTYIQKLSELEKKLIEAKSEAEKRELLSHIKELESRIEEVRREAGKTVVSPEGWQKDETRLVAELGRGVLDIVRDRRPVEYLVRIIPQIQKPPEGERRTEKSLENLIKESGGVVE